MFKIYSTYHYYNGISNGYYSDTSLLQIGRRKVDNMKFLRFYVWFGLGVICLICITLAVCLVICLISSFKEIVAQVKNKKPRS